MGCTLDDVPELAARMAWSSPGFCDDGVPLVVAGKVEFGYMRENDIKVFEIYRVRKKSRLPPLLQNV
jgi:hypothetical protein